MEQTSTDVDKLVDSVSKIADAFNILIQNALEKPLDLKPEETQHFGNEQIRILVGKTNGAAFVIDGLEDFIKNNDADLDGLNGGFFNAVCSRLVGMGVSVEPNITAGLCKKNPELFLHDYYVFVETNNLFNDPSTLEERLAVCGLAVTELGLHWLNHIHA